MSNNAVRPYRLVAASLISAILGAIAGGLIPDLVGLAPQGWTIHDMNRPQPPLVDPGFSCTQDQPGRPPSDAVVLFNGRDLSQWRTGAGEPAPWKVEDDYMEIIAGSGSISTEHGFGDCQLHVEWRTPLPAHGEGQDRGNSGIYLMGRYEVQVLDSYQNKTYPDGQAAAIYGQYPPLVNASRPPGEWQTYDITFRGPRFDSDGKLLRAARITLFHNGVLVQDNVELSGPTGHGEHQPYQAHPDKAPLGLQDHASAVRFRNIWIRELPENDK